VEAPVGSTGVVVVALAVVKAPAAIRIERVRALVLKTVVIGAGVVVVTVLDFVAALVNAD